MAKKPTSPADAASPSTKKGRLLEKLVADLYDVPGVTVEKNVRLAVPSEAARFREIDVLVTGVLAGHQIRIPIECKNYRRRIGVQEIDAFVAKMADLNVPGPGVYVSTIGFSKGALARAAKANIRPLLLSGLVQGRLASAVVDVIRSVVYLLLRITQISIVNEIAHVQDTAALHVYYDRDGLVAGFTGDLVWVGWINGRLDTALGTHEYDVTIPAEWHQRIDGHVSRPKRVTITYEIVALVVSLQGRGTRHALHDPATGLPEKLNAAWELTPDGTPTPVLAFRDEASLEKHLAARDAPIRMATERLPLPRIQKGSIYWPPSERVVQRMAALHEAFITTKTPDPSTLSRVDMEGPELDALFEPIWGGQRVMPDGSLRPAPKPADSSYERPAS